jgi:RHS repeat-associated protein
MGMHTYGYVFDPIGNRITATNNTEVTSYAANGLNQYTAISNAVPILPVHDDDGNMLTNGVLSYSWDGENRLRSVSSNNVLLVTYTYDCRSRRIGKVVGETTHSFLYDGWNLIQEKSGSIATHYVWGLDLSGSLQGAGGVGGLLAVISPLPLGGGQGEGGTVYLPCYDANGNVCEYSSTRGSIVGHYKYSPFGETAVQSGAMADSFAFRFSTKYWEDEAKLYYYGYRFYSSEIGRWANRDPIEEDGGLNLCGFSKNSSINYYDYLGLALPPGTFGALPGISPPVGGAFTIFKILTGTESHGCDEDCHFVGPRARSCHYKIFSDPAVYIPPTTLIVFISCDDVCKGSSYFIMNL